ncbi:MAG: hypothetical protein JO279_09065 [Verrucomicrobia bacterium]|nr:hypothetical protein [Verrucomicrobiota bacterium]
MSVSQLSKAISYIDHPVEHHRTRTFQESIWRFSKGARRKVDEKYLWDW